MLATPTTMKALVLPSPGEDFSLVETSLPTPTIGDGQLLVKMEYAALNPVDTKLAISGHDKWVYPHIPSLDGVGVVVGSYTEHCPLMHKRVMWHSDLTKPGGLAEYMVIDAHAVAEVPDEVSSKEAAILPCAGMTALIALCKLQLEAGDIILIEAGAGAVGQFAIQLAKSRDVTVFTTASKANHKLVRELGADEVFDYKDAKLVDKIKQTLGYQHLDAVLDSVGGDATARNIELLRFNGKLAMINNLPEIDQGLLFTKAPAINMVSLGGAWLSNDLCAQQQLGLKGRHLLELVSTKALKLPRVSLIDFTPFDVTQAMHQQLRRGLVGKQVVKIGQ